MYWYLKHVGFCPVCGKDHSYKTRKYGRKPSNPQDRVVYLSDAQAYDNCIEWENLSF